MQVYYDGLPFYANSILATVVFGALLFGANELIKKYEFQRDKKVKRKNQLENSDENNFYKIYLNYVESEYNKQNNNFNEAERLLDSAKKYEKKKKL